jgi:hypothetical protein
MKKVITFIPSLVNSEVMLEKPKPTKNFIPQWYKDSEYYFEDPPKSGNMVAQGLKTCKAFIDSMMLGYCITTPFDIFVATREDGLMDIRWNGPDEWDGFIEQRSLLQAPTLPVPEGHNNHPLIWATKWGWKTPKGWSTLVVHPLNRHDLPFTTLSGTIDSDNFHGNGNMPFFIKNGFTGIIPEGTPYAQLIPFKRSSWGSYVNDELTEFIINQGHKLRHTPDPEDVETYKNKYWKRKDYK